jgi:alkylated DNA nucleotide flippase Atl1
MATIETILTALNRAHVRATYGAVADVLGISNPRSVGRELRVRRPAASWIVNKRTKRPTGYTSAQLHPNLFQSPRVIATGRELRELLRPR